MRTRNQKSCVPRMWRTHTHVSQFEARMAKALKLNHRLHNRVDSMTKHGFGEGKLTHSKPATLPEIEAIAQCISKIDGIVWAHVVRNSYSLDSKTQKLRADKESQWDIVWEVAHHTPPVDIADIEACATAHGHSFADIRFNTVHDRSWDRQGNPTKHPA